MEQAHKEHQEWVNARQEEQQAKRADHLGRLKTAGVVLVAILVGWFLYRHVLGVLALAPALALAALAYRWDRVYPASDSGNGVIAGVLYHWSFSKQFRKVARGAFRKLDLSKKILPRILVYGYFSDGAPNLADFINKNLDHFLRDLPDLKRLAEDATYAEPHFHKGVLSRFIPLFAVDMLFHLVLATMMPAATAWCILTAILTAVICWYVARAGALSNLNYYCGSYLLLYQYLVDEKKEQDHKAALTADGLSAMVREQA